MMSMKLKFIKIEKLIYKITDINIIKQQTSTINDSNHLIYQV
jgi:hypothetical protein